MAGIVQFKTNEPEFSLWVKRYAEAAILTINDAFEAQGRLLCDRLMKLTPPLSGHSIKKSLWMRDVAGTNAYKVGLVNASGGDMKAAFEKFSPFRDPEIEDMSAKAIGDRRVEKDIKRVIKGVRGATPSHAKESPLVVISQTNPQTAIHSNEVEWAVRQKCQGKDAFRIYADRSGNVYGVDAEHFLPHPSMSDLGKIHEEHRGKRGRVTTAGSKDIIVGRWRWLNIAVTSETLADEYITLKKAMVGQGRGGWAAGFVALGGKISLRSWVGRHSAAGKCTGWPPTAKGVINVTIINNSAWASNGDPERVIQNALAGREHDIEKSIQLILEKRWGAGAGGYNSNTKLW